MRSGLILWAVLSLALPPAEPVMTCTIRPSWEYASGMHIVILVAGSGALPQTTPTPRPTATPDTSVVSAAANPADRVYLAYADPPADLYVVGGLVRDISFEHPFTLSYAAPSRAQRSEPFTVYSCPPGARPYRSLLPLALR